MLTEIQMFAIGAAASVIVWFLRLVKADATSGWLTAAVYGVSLVLAWIFAAPVLPPFPPFADLAVFVPALLNWAGELLVPLSAFVGFATLIYNALLKKILDQYVAPLIQKK